MSVPGFVEIDMTGVSIPVRLAVGLQDAVEIGTVDLEQPGGCDFASGLADLLEATAAEIRKGL